MKLPQQTSPTFWVCLQHTSPHVIVDSGPSSVPLTDSVDKVVVVRGKLRQLEVLTIVSVDSYTRLRSDRTRLLRLLVDASLSFMAAAGAIASRHSALTRLSSALTSFRKHLSELVAVPEHSLVASRRQDAGIGRARWPRAAAAAGVAAIATSNSATMTMAVVELKRGFFMMCWGDFRCNLGFV